MTAAKIAITLPPEQLARAKRAVRSGRAESVSAYIVRALTEQAHEEGLQALVDDLVAQHGEPTSQEKAWARRVLRRRRKA
jgi:Arc/MetJ-type ribon-helix-helix transcriptional regulator